MVNEWPKRFCATRGVSVQQVAFLCNKWGVRFAQQLHINSTAGCEPCKATCDLTLQLLNGSGCVEGRGVSNSQAQCNPFLRMDKKSSQFFYAKDRRPRAQTL